MKKSVGIAAILFLTLFLMLFHADWVTEGARHGLLLWYNVMVLVWMTVSRFAYAVNGGYHKTQNKRPHTGQPHR